MKFFTVTPMKISTICSIKMSAFLQTPQHFTGVAFFFFLNTFHRLKCTDKTAVHRSQFENHYPGNF